MYPLLLMAHPSPKVLFCQISQHTLCIPLCSWMSFRAKKLVYLMLFYVHFQTCSFSTQDHSVASACFLLTPVFNFCSPKKVIFLFSFSITEENYFLPPSPSKKDFEGKSGTKVSRTFSYIKNKMSSSKKSKVSMSWAFSMWPCQSVTMAHIQQVDRSHSGGVLKQSRV